MNLAERIAARKKAAQEEARKAAEEEHNRKVAELGDIPYDEILKAIERRFDESLNLTSTGIDVLDGYFNPSYYSSHNYNPVRIPKCWEQPICEYLQANGFIVDVEQRKEWVWCIRITLPM